MKNHPLLMLVISFSLVMLYTSCATTQTRVVRTDNTAKSEPAVASSKPMSNRTPASTEEPSMTSKVGNAAMDCAAEKLKVQACGNLPWPASTICEKTARSGKCLGF